MPTRTTHHTAIEILWTVLPVVILLVIAVPSFKLLYFQETTPKTELTLKVIGMQGPWQWHYDYPDNGNFGFDSFIVDDKDLKDKSLHLLDVDNEVVLPVNTNVLVQITSNDVMHSWFVPSLAVQKYAVPGRLNEVWLEYREGRHLFRRVQPDLRREPRLHADQGACPSPRRPSHNGSSRPKPNSPAKTMARRTGDLAKCGSAMLPAQQ